MSIHGRNLLDIRIVVPATDHTPCASRSNSNWCCEVAIVPPLIRYSDANWALLFRSQNPLLETSVINIIRRLMQVCSEMKCKMRALELLLSELLYGFLQRVKYESAWYKWTLYSIREVLNHSESPVSLYNIWVLFIAVSFRQQNG
jgi:hypothetical protein